VNRFKKCSPSTYIGKAAPGYLSERFKSYFSEKESVSGRPKLVVMLNKYRNRLFFWWAELPRIYVDAVEEHSHVQTSLQRKDA